MLHHKFTATPASLAAKRAMHSVTQTGVSTGASNISIYRGKYKLLTNVAPAQLAPSIKATQLRPISELQQMYAPCHACHSKCAPTPCHLAASIRTAGQLRCPNALPRATIDARNVTGVTARQ